MRIVVTKQPESESENRSVVYGHCYVIGIVTLQPIQMRITLYCIRIYE